MTGAPPVLLYDGECNVCRVIAHWVETAARNPAGAPYIVTRAIGEDPAAIRLLNPGLTIWQAYAAPHVLMPDGSMTQAGYAVTEVFRCLPSMRWAARLCGISVAGIQPFQMLMNLGYVILADIRPLLGCESCGAVTPWVKPLHRLGGWMQNFAPGARKDKAVPHFNKLRSAKPGKAAAQE